MIIIASLQLQVVLKWVNFPYHLSEFPGGGTLHNNVIIKLVAHQQRWTNPTDNSLQMLDANIENLGATPMLFFIQHHISTLLVFLIEQPSSVEKSNSNRNNFATNVTSCLKCFFYSNAYITCAQHPFLEWDKIAKL